MIQNIIPLVKKPSLFSFDTVNFIFLVIVLNKATNSVFQYCTFNFSLLNSHAQLNYFPLFLFKVMRFENSQIIV